MQQENQFSLTKYASNHQKNSKKREPFTEVKNTVNTQTTYRTVPAVKRANYQPRYSLSHVSEDPEESNKFLPSDDLQLKLMRNAFDFLMKAYKIAVEEKYKFFTYGDAMLII